MINGQIYENSRIRTQKKQLLFEVTAFLWCHQESNRGHKDFQSFALPTELWHHHFLFADAKVDIIFESPKFFQKNIEKVFVIQNYPYLCTCKTESESSAVGSALRSGRRGRAFESPLSDQAKKRMHFSMHPLFFFKTSRRLR